MTNPFIIAETPDIYAIGCQPRFTTRLVKDGKRRSRAVLIPSFAQTGIMACRFQVTGFPDSETGGEYPGTPWVMIFRARNAYFYCHCHLHV
jgi:hypothetical protein